MADPDYQAQLNAWYSNQKKQNQPFTNNPSGLQNTQNTSVIQQLYDQVKAYDPTDVGTKAANDQANAAAAQGKYYSVEDWKKAQSDGTAFANSQKSLILGKAVDALIKTAQPDPLPTDVQKDLARYDSAISNLHLLQSSYNNALNKSGAIFGGNFKSMLGDWVHSNQTNGSVKQFEALRESLTPSVAQTIGYLQGADARPGIQAKIEDILPGDKDTLPDANAKFYNLETLALNGKASLLHQFGFGNYQVANQTKETQDQFEDLAKRQLTVGQMYDKFNQAPDNSSATPSATPSASPGQPTVQGNNTTATQGFSSQTQNALNGFMQARQAQLQQNPGVNTPVAQGNP
jgi:hypothetical protein